MTILSIVVFILMAWRLLTRYTGSAFVTSVERFVPSDALARFCSVAVVPLYALQLAFVVLENRVENVGAASGWMATLPIAVFDDRSGTSALDLLFGTLNVTVGLLEAAALAVVVLALRHAVSSINSRLIVVSALALAALSVTAPVMGTTDPYQFAATGVLGFHSYNSSTDAFLGTPYAAFEKRIPMNRVVYGPLWIAIDIAQTHFGAKIYDKIEWLRFTNIGFVACFLWLLARSRLSRSMIAAGALNPALWQYAVADPHADIEGVVLLTAAFFFARHSRLLPAGAFVFLAGLIKLPFVIIGGAVLTPLPKRNERCAVWLIAVALVAVVSSLLPSGAYVENLVHYARLGATKNWSGDWLLLAPIVTIATVVLLMVRRSLFGMAWLFHQMAPLAAPWYIMWGIPYALASDRLALYLVSLPLAAAKAQLWGVPAQVLVVTLAIGLALDIARTRRVQWSIANEARG